MVKKQKEKNKMINCAGNSSAGVNNNRVSYSSVEAKRKKNTYVPE